MFALVFTALVTPFEAAFSDPFGMPSVELPSENRYFYPSKNKVTRPQEVDGSFVINRIIDMIFLIDMMVQFVMAYEDGVVWIKGHGYIVAHYLRTWFLIDLVSQANLVFDFIALDSSDSSDDYYILLRMVRSLRLIKLVRLPFCARHGSFADGRVASPCRSGR
eukprot:7230474-Prymnesium_polylepis.2